MTLPSSVLLPTSSPQVFDATNTTRERRATIVRFAEQNGFKVSSLTSGQTFTNERQVGQTLTNDDKRF